MKIRNILSIAALALPLAMWARPANPNQVLRMVNPDGTIVEVLNHGDERFSYYTLTDGETIVERSNSGYWVASMNNGMNLKATSANDINYLRSKNRPFNFSPVEEPGTRMAPIDKVEGRTYFPTIADDVHSLVVLVEFSDTPFSVPEPKKAFEKMLNEEGYSDYGSCGSARDYYIKTSNGKFRPTFDVTDVVKLKNPSVYYNGKGSNVEGAGKNGRFGELIQEALTYLDEQGMDFSKYDYDGDGDIDTVFFFYSGYGQADSHIDTTIWPHQADFKRYTLDYEGSLKLEPLYLDGKRVGPYACSNELNGSKPPMAPDPWLDGVGAFIHEFGHVLGLPDLYDSENTGTKSPGYYSVMANGSYNDYSTCPPLFSAWEQWVCHWLEFDDVQQQGKELTIPSLSQSGKATRIQIQRPVSRFDYYKDEYFVLETRDDDSWDRTMPEHGMLIWHIYFDHSTWVNNVVNARNKPHVELIESGANIRPRTTAWGNDIKNSYIEPSMSNALKATQSTLPANNPNTYASYLTDIKFDAEKGETTLRYNLDKEVSDAVTAFNEPYRVKDTAKEFVLSWKPVEGADGYYLTVYFQNPSGTKIYIDELNNYFTTDWEYRISNYLDSYKNVQLCATVQVHNKYPSKKISDTLKFVPAQLEEKEYVSGVEDITSDDFIVIGAEGYIIAPEGAEVYNLSGVRTGLTDLPAGVYIVRVGNAAKKVMVK